MKDKTMKEVAAWLLVDQLWNDEECVVREYSHLGAYQMIRQQMNTLMHSLDISLEMHLCILMGS